MRYSLQLVVTGSIVCWNVEASICLRWGHGIHHIMGHGHLGSSKWSWGNRPTSPSTSSPSSTPSSLKYMKVKIELKFFVGNKKVKRIKVWNAIPDVTVWPRFVDDEDPEAEVAADLLPRVFEWTFMCRFFSSDLNNPNEIVKYFLSVPKKG